MRPPRPYSTRSLAGRPSNAVSVMLNEVATTHDGRDITQPYVRGLRQPRDTRLLGAVDWGVYDRILEDDQVQSTFQQRRLAVVSCNWNVLPGDEKDPRSVEAADRFGETLDRIGWDRITDKMLFAIYHGYAVAEVIWGHRDGLLDFDDLRVRHARRFRFDDDNRLRLLTRHGGEGEIMPDRKFWVVTSGGSNDDEPYGRGLAEWLYWPTLFKRNGLRFWNVFLDKFGTPTAIGKYRPGTSRAEIAKLLAALQALATDSGIAVPEGMVIELLQAAKSGTADFEKLVRYMDEAIAKVVLSQTMTTQDGSSLSQAQVHAGVKREVISADADLLSSSFNSGPARWWTDFNYGPDVASPLVNREVEEEADQKAQAETDEVLKRLGWERTDESFLDVYGDGYVRVQTTAAAPAAKPGAGPVAALPTPADPANDDDATEDAAQPDAKAASFAADDPRPLYVHRKLMNPEDLIAWARSQGFASTLPANDMHVTVTYSKRPVNWMKMGGFWGWTGDNSEHLVPPGGPRLVERFGEGAIVLCFFSGHLEQRHREMREAGASWDHADYFPHVTISYDGAGIDLAQVEPYRGELRFGPEIFEPIEDDWQNRIRETSFAAPAGPVAAMTEQLVTVADDQADELVDQLIEESGYRAARALTDPILGAIGTANSADELAELLGTAPGDERPLAQSIENASFALRLGEESA